MSAPVDTQIYRCETIHDDHPRKQNLGGALRDFFLSSLAIIHVHLPVCVTTKHTKASAGQCVYHKHEGIMLNNNWLHISFEESSRSTIKGDMKDNSQILFVREQVTVSRFYLANDKLNLFVSTVIVYVFKKIVIIKKKKNK